MKDITINEFYTSTYLFDTLIPMITPYASKSANIKKLINTIQKVNDKNADVLQTNIVGYPLLVNEKDQAEILSCLDLTKEQVLNICKESPRLKAGKRTDDGPSLAGLGKIGDQFAFALPLLLLSGIFYKMKKMELSQGIFLFTFYRAYSSKVASIFKYGTVDVPSMEYTVNIELNDKSFIHKYGTVYNVLVESASTAYDTYIERISGKKEKPTDDLLFNNIFYSAIFSKTGSWISSLYGSYLKVKSSGKALKYEQSFFTSTNDDTGDTDYNERDISSDSAVKNNILNKAVTKFNISPIDSFILTAAARYGFNTTSTDLYESYLTQAIRKIADTRISEVPKYFDAIIGSFLDSSDERGIKNNANEIKTAKFLAYSKRIFRVSNTNNSNIREEQNMTEDFLLTCSDKYLISGSTRKRQMKYALFMYFVMFIQKS